MRKAGVLASLFVAVLLAVVVADAQQTTKLPRIGFLSAGGSALTLLVPRHSGWLCATVAT